MSQRIYYPGQQTSMVVAMDERFEFTEGQWNTGSTRSPWMPSKGKHMSRFVGTLAIALTLSTSLSAQISPAEAGAFMGSWAVMLETPQGNGGQITLNGTGTKK